MMFSLFLGSTDVWGLLFFCLVHFIVWNVLETWLWFSFGPWTDILDLDCHSIFSLDSVCGSGF